MPGDQTPTVAAYHRTLSAHLSKLLESASPSRTPRPQARTNNNRPSSSKTQSSNSLSKMSSGGSSDQHPAAVGVTGTSSRSTETSTLPTPPELASRPDDHIHAWKEAGHELFTLPSSFNLSLDHRRRSTSNEEDTAKEGKRVTGLGIDLAMSKQQHMALKMGLMVDPIISAPAKVSSRPIDVRRLMPMASQESLRSFGGVTGVSPNVASGSSVQPSEHVARQHRRRSGESSSRPTTRARRELIESAPLRDVNDTDDKEEEYEARRELRLKRRLAELKAKIDVWRQDVQIINIEMPEIEPTPPTPSIASGMMRLSPLTFAPAGSILLPPATVPAPNLSAQNRPTSLPPQGPKTVSPPDDLNVRLRALDALLGDMSLVQPRALSTAARCGSPSGSLRIVGESRPTFDFDVALGMPTPKARRDQQVMSYY